MKSPFRLLRYALPYKRGLATVLITMAMAIGLEVLRPWPIKLLVDQVLGHQPVPGSLSRALSILPGGQSADGMLLWVCLGTVFLFLAATAMSMINTIATVGLGQRMTYELGADLFLHLQRLSLLFHNRRPVGDSIARITGDAYCAQTLLASVILPVLQAVVTLVAMFAIMWRLQPAMTLLSLGVTPFMVLAIRAFGKPMKSKNRERRSLEGRMMALVQQSLSAIPAVQAYTREEVEHARFRSVAEETVTAYQRSTLAGLWFKLFVGLVTAVGTAGIMWVGARYAMEGKMTVGGIFIFLSYLQALYTPINSIAYTAATVHSTAANADRVLEILDLPQDVRDSPDAKELLLRGDVRFERVTFGYELGRPVLHEVTLEAHRGDVVAVVGPTGAGKTTLLSMLIRFFDPWSGRVIIDGHNIRDIRLRCLREQIAIALQEPFIFPLTVAENIAYGKPGASRQEIEAAGKAACADEFIRGLPRGYDTLVGERGATLSGGEKQRLSIARAFLKDAPILILDEPTSAVDSRTEGRLLDAVQQLMRGRTTFIIAHRLSTIRGADRILVLDRGELVEEGSHAALLAMNGLYARLYRKQMEIATHDPLIELRTDG